MSDTTKDHDGSGGQVDVPLFAWRPSRPSVRWVVAALLDEGALCAGVRLALLLAFAYATFAFV